MPAGRSQVRPCLQESAFSSPSQPSHKALSSGCREMSSPSSVKDGGVAGSRPLAMGDLANLLIRPIPLGEFRHLASDVSIYYLASSKFHCLSFHYLASNETRQLPTAEIRSLHGRAALLRGRSRPSHGRAALVAAISFPVATSATLPCIPHPP